MEQETARKHGASSNSVLPKIRLLATCLLAAALSLGVYYFFFVQRNYNYLSGRDFRFLAAIGSQMRSSISTRSKLIQSLAQENDLSARLGDEATKRQLIDEFARGYEKIEFSNGPAGSDGQPVVVLPRSPDEAVIEVYAAPLKGVMKLRTVAEPLFRSRRAFEALLLANADGEVVYHQGAQDLIVTRLGPLLEKNPGKAGPGGASRLLSSFSGAYDVELNGQEYRLFVEPVHLPLQRLDAPAAGAGSIWLVCGLVPRKEFIYKSLAVSSSLLSGLLGLIILAALSWPFLKLVLISNTQRVSAFDVILLCVCSVLGLSIVTLFLLDTVYFQKLEDRAKSQLEHLTDEMDQNARREIQAAYPVMTGLEKEIVPWVESDPIDGIETNLLKTHAELFFSNYPLAQTFSIIGRDGRQIYKGTVNSQQPPLILVRDRAYFKQSLARNTWDLRALEPSPPPPAEDLEKPFYIESVVGWTTGTPIAILAKPVSPQGRAAVASLAIPMVSLVNPVLPPGVKFAVVDNDTGRVLFHSEPERLNEDFLVETDQDRRLRSAIFARHAETLPTRYWGEDYFARVAPIKGLPWTIITLQDMRILRAVNVDWISTTLLMILLYTIAIVLVLVGGALAKPAYRADWIWPDAERHQDYRILARAHLILLVGFALALWGVRGSSQLLGLTFLLPVFAVLMAYDRLRRRPAGDKPRREAGGGKAGRKPAEVLVPAMEALALGAFAALLSRAPLEEGFSALLRATVFLLVVLSCLAANSTAARTTAELVRRWRQRPGSAKPETAASTSPSQLLESAWKPSVAASYCLAGVLLLLLGAVMPTAGFFKIGYNLHSISFLRHGQLRMALDLKRRAAEALSVASRIAAPERSCFLQQRLAVNEDMPASRRAFHSPFQALDIYTDVFYGTRVELPAPGRPQPFSPGKCKASVDSDIFPALLEGWLPRYSEPAADMRELLHSSSSDCTWYWENGPASFADTFHSRDYPRGELRLVHDPSLQLSGVPAQKAFYLSTTGGVFAPSFVVLSFLFSGVAVLAAILVRFVARRIFLIDLLEPLWRDEQETGPATLGRNLFLVGRDRNWKEDVKRNLFFWFHLKDLEDPEKGWPACRPALLESDRVILVEGFEHRLRDPEFNLKKLLFLEELAAMQERTVVVISTISPSRLFSREIRGEYASMSSPSMVERWRNLLSMFTVHEDDLQGVLRRVESSTTIDSEVLKLECGINPHLLSIAQDLDHHVRYLSREQILEEFGERAEGYYQGLWASCSSEEQVVLEHLAEEGLVNEKSRRIIRRLMARGFVRRDPNFRLINETFRRFVASATQKHEVLVLEREAAPSAWDRLHIPLFVGLAASLVFFFITQQELLDGVSASVTGITAGLPAILKIFNFFGSNREESLRLPHTK